MGLKLIVGLGNPGPAYQETRHNAGAWYVETLAAGFGVTWKHEKKLHANLCQLPNRCRLLIPSTFMNESGLAIQSVLKYYDISPEEMLIAHDELALDVGVIKLKANGGHAGHNGLRDTMAHLGTKQFWRLRIGIGHPGHKHLVHQYVLGRPSVADRQTIFHALEQVHLCQNDIFNGNWNAAMKTLHT